MKYVQITRELFFKLLSYHLLDKFEEKEEIEKGLEAKLNTMLFKIENSTNGRRKRKVTAGIS